MLLSQARPGHGADRERAYRSADELAAGAPHGVAQRFRLALPLYLCLLLVLSLAGILNQRLLRSQLELLAAKESLLAEVAEARVLAAAVDGPEAVAAWAVSEGMVPVPEAGAARLVAASPAPTATVTEPSMELRTVWR